ncbi:DUF1287 domain-containing protein [uncultured Stenotrophomonas sp.]|uniref:DUF1287 domain-containing protein n=1 Tax=uncultured Stenotrophomonas sp. TaxID=165438 RepID=UPI0025ECECE0|nr:DUF1287 domain-containing protein [uncultured Stenotrophomonas sp.]
MRAWPSALMLMAIALLAGCRPQPNGSETSLPSQAANEAPPQVISPALVAAARAQIGVTTRYDPAYFSLTYPNGDPPLDRGVCTDVVIRALRMQGVDLQQRIHEDMRGDFAAYPQLWGLSRTDRNIDHRRVPNQMRWFQRQGWELPISTVADDYAAGDIVAWKLNGNGLLHVGIVSDQRLYDGTPLVLHNIAQGTQEQDLLFRHTIIGHYRMQN